MLNYGPVSGISENKYVFDSIFIERLRSPRNRYNKWHKGKDSITHEWLG